MGIIRWAIKGNYKKYYNDLKRLSEKNGKNVNLMMLDTAVSFLFFKSGLQDYLNYKFYEKNFEERNTYATIGYQNKFYKLAANIDYADFFSNKENFHKNFQKFTKREFVSGNDEYYKVEKFIRKYKFVIRKPICGLGGANVEKINSKNIKDIKNFYDALKKDNCLLEEMIIQDERWAKLNPDSVNTIRVVTKCVNQKSSIMFAVARIGSGQSIVDNFHQGGIGVKVDIENGKLIGPAIDKAGNITDVVPSTKMAIDGFIIPYWEDVIKMVNEAAKVNDKVNIVGWDVAISKDGPVIIEGNRGPGMDIVQVLYQRGIKAELKKLKKEILESRS